MKIIDKEKEKYQKVHTDDYQYGLGMRQVNDLLNENFDFSKRFNELAKKSKNALDIACGGGTVMDYVDTLGCKPSGIDISEAAIKKVDRQQSMKAKEGAVVRRTKRKSSNPNIARGCGAIMSNRRKKTKYS